MRERRGLSLLCVAVYATAATIGAFTGGLWAALGIGLAALLFISLWALDGVVPLPPRWLGLLAAAALAALLIELPLSSRFDISLHVWLQLVTIFLPLLLLASPRLQGAAASSLFTPVVALAAAVGAAALGLELQSGGAILQMLKKPGASVTEYNRGMAHLAILAFPLFAGLWAAGGKRMMAVLALFLLFPASLTESHTAKLALVAGAVCAALACYRPVWVRRGLGAVAVLLMGWPFYAQCVFSFNPDAVERWHSSWRHRMEIWDFLSYRIADRPIFGWGLGTTHTLDFSQPHGRWYQVVPQSGAPHAHNFITELWVETGVVGLAFGLAFLLLSLRAAGRLHPSLRPFALGGWAAALIVAMFGFDFWTDALWAAFALSAFAFGMLDQRIHRGDYVADIQIIQARSLPPGDNLTGRF